MFVWSTLLLPLQLLLIVPPINMAPRRQQLQLRTQINPEYMRAIAAYRRLEQRVPQQELRALTAIGVLNGARKAGQQMEQYLIEVLQDLLDNARQLDDAEVDDEKSEVLVPKIESIEKQLLRDRHAIMILKNAMDLSVRAIDAHDFKRKMEQARQALQQGSDALMLDAEINKVDHVPADQLQFVERSDVVLGKRIATLRRNIMQHVKTMQWLVNEKIEQTLASLLDEAPQDGLLARASEKVVRKRAATRLMADAGSAVDMPAEVRMIESILSEDDFQGNLIDERTNTQPNEPSHDFILELHPKSKPNPKINSKYKRNNASKPTLMTTPLPQRKQLSSGSNMSTAAKSARQEVSADDTSMPDFAFDDDEAAPAAPAGGGGLVGIITSLSGGEGGSDVGALIGALTGLVSTLFGPGGLDIETLISTSTALISGLLAGNKNFGTVLGQYVGTAFDGLSGGGGAINNGQFIGNFLGTVVASLSADPEEDDAPPQPLIFAQSLLSSFIEAKNRQASGEVSEEKKDGGTAAGGSDSGSFVKQIVAHLVSNLVGIVLNASVGASGGASQASSALFTGSSSASHHTKPIGVGHHAGK